MRAIVFGAEGTLGRPLVESLKISQYDIVCVDKKDGDLRDYKTWLKYLSGETFDEVYQMAADSGNSKYLENYSRSMNSSLMNLYCLDALHEAKEIGRVFFPSSFYVYGDACLYSLEKLYAELLFMHSPFDTRIARLFPTYGPGAIISGDNEKVTTAMCRKIITSSDMDRFVFKSSRLSPCRNFVYIDDAIRGIRMLMQNPKPTIIDLAGKEKISVSEVLYTAIEISDKDISIIVEDDMAINEYIEPDLENTQKKIGWFPFYSFRQGMEKLYKYVEESINEIHGEDNVPSSGDATQNDTGPGEHLPFNLCQGWGSGPRTREGTFNPN